MVASQSAMTIDAHRFDEPADARRHDFQETEPLAMMDADAMRMAGDDDSRR